LQPRTSKTCDLCKARKVRCESGSIDTLACVNCSKRRVPCRFSRNRRKVRQPVPELLPTPMEVTSSSISEQNFGLCPKYLYIDRILRDEICHTVCDNETSVLKRHNCAKLYAVGSSGIAFFSESRVKSISNILGHTRFKDVLEKLATTINLCIGRNSDASGLRNKVNRSSTAPEIPEEIAKSYSTAYFVNIHPIYPFIDQKSFETRAFDSEIPRKQSSQPFLATYFTVLALGSQYKNGDRFDSNDGIARTLYQTALEFLPEILVLNNSLESIQASAIFAHNSSYIHLEHMLVTEAARMVQLIGFNRAIYGKEVKEICNRTFWVVYILDKLGSFACNRTSAILDYDISAPIPKANKGVFEDFDWFLCQARFSRLLSRIYETLFSASASLNDPESISASIDMFNYELEAWRMSTPIAVRPGETIQPNLMSNHISMAILVRIHYYFYSVVIALSRLNLRHSMEQSHRQLESKKALLDSARIVIELTTYIDTEAYNPIWILGSMPLSAMFIIFDIIVYNPTYPQTNKNLGLLGLAAGYFCRLEYASNGFFRSSILSEIGQIARQYVRDTEL
ncbi:fungal-specific transcription factor domain-containing protein, partial [Bisporella sp. PMI_857]